MVIEENDCLLMYRQPHQNYLLFDIVSKPYYLIWWLIADLFPKRTRMCEIMSSLGCDTSLLKATDYRKSFSHRVYARCDLGIEETIRHLVMQCSFYSDMCAELFDALSRLNSEAAGIVVNDPPSYFHVIMGRHPENADFQEMIEIWMLSGSFISKLYLSAVAGCK